MCGDRFIISDMIGAKNQDNPVSRRPKKKLTWSDMGQGRHHRTEP